MSHPATYTDPELPLRMRAAGKAVTDTDIAELCGLLHGRGWLTAEQITEKRPRWHDRYIRKLANASRGQVLSWPGSPGYRLTVEASAIEREVAIGKLRHQAIEMGHRASDIARVHHTCPRA